jgi:serine/threonine protein kinase
MILEFLHGAHIRVRIDRGPLPWDAISRIGDQTMSALQLAHRLGITHRDLKPENIFISIDDAGEERVKLLDFGVSKLRGVGRTTGAFAMLGTPSYMSPEQAQGHTDLIGPSTDVWAMGTILYEMATQRVAFTGESLGATVVNITSGRPTAIEQLRAGLKAALEPKLRMATPTQGTQAVPKTPTTGPMPNATVTGSMPIQTPPFTTKSSSSPSLSPLPVTALPPSRNLNFWIIGTTAIVAIIAVLLVVFLN